MAINRNKILFKLFMVVVLVIAVFAGYTWLTLNWSFSKGERVGYIQKFSQKGWLCKTWEGELHMSSVPGSIPEKFLFSVRDDGVALKLNNLMSKKVSLTYEQHDNVPSKCFGETAYFVTGIRVLE